jgi:hypothetical protein
VVASAAAVFAVVAGILLAYNRPSIEPIQPVPTPSPSTPQPISYSADVLSPAATVRLPRWVVSANPSSFGGGYAFDQTGGDRSIKLFSVSYMYPIGASTITKPSYARLVEDWKAIQTRGFGTVSAVATTRVDNRVATSMTVTITKQADGFAYCEGASDVRTNTDACAGLYPGRLMHVAIVDQGPTSPPTLLWESESSTSPDLSSPSAASEFTTWLASITFH